MNWRTHPAVVAADQAVQKAYNAGMENARIPVGSARRLPGLFQDGELGRAFATAYETWMNLRAKYGDPFALNLGYGR